MPCHTLADIIMKHSSFFIEFSYWLHLYVWIYVVPGIHNFNFRSYHMDIWRNSIHEQREQDNRKECSFPFIDRKHSYSKMLVFTELIFVDFLLSICQAHIRFPITYYCLSLLQQTTKFDFFFFVWNSFSIVPLRGIERVRL